MRILTKEESQWWLKKKGLDRRPPEHSVRYRFAWPEGNEAAIRELSSRLAALTDWSSGAIVLDRPGMPRKEALEELCSIRETYGHPTWPEDIQLGTAPGHLLDDSEERNKENIIRLLHIMMTGYLEGILTNKNGRVAFAFHCGIIEAYLRDKSVTGIFRTILRELQLKSF